MHHKKMGRTAAYAEEARHGPRPPGGGEAPLAFSIANRFCMALLYGRAGRLTAQTRLFLARADRESWNDGSRVPPHRNAKGEVLGG